MYTGNVGLDMDMDGGHDIAYERIMAECLTWNGNCRPIFMSEDGSDLGNCPVLVEKVSIWMEEARQIAVAGYKQVLEDDPDVCDPESDSENSDHGEMWRYSDIYTPEMLGPDGKPKTGGPQQLSAAQVLDLRASAKRTAPQHESGMAGVQATVVETKERDTREQRMFLSKTCPR
jgi:hypothetical protein